MSFYECLKECIGNHDLVDSFDRLTGHNLVDEVAKRQVVKKLDESADYVVVLEAHQCQVIQAFIKFCHQFVWSSVKQEPVSRRRSSDFGIDHQFG